MSEYDKLSLIGGGFEEYGVIGVLFLVENVVFVVEVLCEDVVGDWSYLIG